MPEGKNTVAQPVTFFARFGQLRLIKEPAQKVQVGLQFVLTKSVFAQFERGKYVTNDLVMIEWLRAHPRYGYDFFEDDRSLAQTVKEESEAQPEEPTEPPVVMPTKKGGRHKGGRKKKAAPKGDASEEGA